MGSYPPGTTSGHLAAAGIITLCAYCNREILGDVVYLATGLMGMDEAYHPICAARYGQQLSIEEQFEQAFYTAMDVLADVEVFGYANKHQRQQAVEQLEGLIKNLLNLKDVVEQVNANGFKKPDQKHTTTKNKGGWL